MGKWITLAVLVAVFAALLTAGVVRAQEDSATIQYAEGGTDPVVTLTATDPEMDEITWSRTAGADMSLFTIGADDGVLTFNNPPDYEASTDGDGGGDDDNDNTYVVVVTATNTDEPANTDRFTVNVEVTDVEEDGVVAWTVDPDGGDTHTAAMPKLRQFQVGASLMASATDGDVAGDTKTVTNAIWRWYRSSSKTSMGTLIEEEDEATYTVVSADVGMYLRAVAHYVISGNVEQETASLTSDYPVLAARTGDNALKFDPAAIDRPVAEGEMGARVGPPVRATGNHGAVNYTLADDTSGDNDKFKIDQKTGQITILWDLDRDTTTEATETESGNCDGGDNECVITVRATDASGAVTADTAVPNPPVFVDATVTIELTDVNEKPGFTTETAALSPTAITSPENRAALFGDEMGDGFSDDATDVTYAATDPEERIINYRLMGSDRAKFELSESQVLSFSTEPDYEMPADANGDNKYEVTVRASDGTLHEDRMVTVTVTDVNEAPVVSGPSTRNFAENGEGTVATFTATDPEDATSITWDIAASGTDHDGTDGPLVEADAADEDHFDISGDGVLTFDIGGDDDTGDMSVSPDFEAPKGAAPTETNTNTYSVVVSAADAATDGQTGYHKVTVTVTNVAEPGEVTWTTATTPTLVQFQVGVVLTATASDGDIEGAAKAFTASTADGVSDVIWRWYRGGSVIDGADANTYTVANDDAGSRIRAVVTYRVGESTTQYTASLTSDYPVLAERSGNSELKFDPAEVERQVAEGDKGAMVGAPVTATGNHGAVNYTLVTGDDAAKFKIDQKTGQITTMQVLNREHTAADTETEFGCGDDYECTVTVRATDASGDATVVSGDNIDATVTIKLTDVNEKPVFGTTGNPETIMRDENMVELADSGREAEVTYAAEDPEDLNVNLTLMGDDGDLFSLDADGVLSFKMAPDFEEPADANGDNKYQVTVRASDGTMYADQMVTVTVTDDNEAPMILGIGLSVSGDRSLDYAENGTDAVGTYTATGPDADSATWTVTGDDASHFRVDPRSGASVMLMFWSSPDFEDRADVNTDNVYEVTLEATDGTDTDSRDVMVTVTDADDPGKVTGLPTSAMVGDELTAVLEDDDDITGTTTWQWARDGASIADATSANYTVAEADAEMSLRATATYTDAFGTDKTATSDAVMVMAADDRPQAVRDYDTDGTPGISLDEMFVAIDDYFNGETTLDDMFEVIDAYFG